MLDLYPYKSPFAKGDFTNNNYLQTSLRAAKTAPAFFVDAAIRPLFPLPADLPHIGGSIANILSLAP